MGKINIEMVFVEGHLDILAHQLEIAGMNKIFKTLVIELNDILLPPGILPKIDKGSVQPPFKDDLLADAGAEQDIRPGIDAALNRAAEDADDGVFLADLPTKINSLLNACTGQHGDIRIFSFQDGIPGGVPKQDGNPGRSVELHELLQGYKGFVVDKTSLG